MPRPLKPINWDLVEKRMEAGSSAKEIAGALHIEINTFYDRFKLEYGESFAEFADSFKAAGHGNVRFLQYTKAMQGNTNMLQLLGREWLGQGSMREEIPRNDEIMSVRHENMFLRAEVTELKEKLDVVIPKEDSQS